MTALLLIGLPAQKDFYFWDFKYLGCGLIYPYTFIINLNKIIILLHWYSFTMNIININVYVH